MASRSGSASCGRKEYKIPDGFFGVGSSPLLEGDKLIVMVGGQPNSGVVAFEAATGKPLWNNVGKSTWDKAATGWGGEAEYEWLGDEMVVSYSSPICATIHGQRHLLVCTRQGLVSLDPKTGEHRFSFWFRSRQDQTVTAMTPVVDGDRIFLSNAYYKTGSVLLRVKPGNDGVTEVWRSLALEIHWTRPVLAGGHLYAFSGRNEPDARFRCVELATGAVKWDRNEGWPNGGHAKLRAGEAAPNVFGRGSAILADGKLIALGEAGLLGLFKPTADRLEELARCQQVKMFNR